MCVCVCVCVYVCVCVCVCARPRVRARAHTHTHIHSGAEYLSRYSDMLWAGGSGDRVLLSARFSAPVQIVLGPSQPPIE
jgi:hypothetical protein